MCEKTVKCVNCKGNGKCSLMWNMNNEREGNLRGICGYFVHYKSKQIWSGGEE